MDNGLGTHAPVMVAAFLAGLWAHVSQIIGPILATIVVGLLSALINSAVRPVVEAWIADRREARQRARGNEPKELPPGT